MQELKIEYISPKELTPYENNTRKHAPDDIEQIKKSILVDGFNDPIGIWGDQNIIVEGHGRQIASLELGLEKVPVIRLDHMTDDQRRDYAIRHNRTAELSAWDFSKLEEEIAQLEIEGHDFDGLNFFFEEEKDFSDAERQVEEDSIPALPTEAVAKLGDIWKLGDHRLMCGNSCDADDIRKLMGDGTEKGRMLFTSPPYSDMRDYEGGKDLSVTNLVQFIAKYRPYTDYQCVNLGIQRKNNEIVQYWDEYIRTARENGYKLLAWNVWDKLMCGSIGQQSAFFPVRHEWIFVFGTEFYEINKTWSKNAESIHEAKRRKVRQADGSMKESGTGDMSDPYKQMESVLPLLSEIGKIRELHPATFPVGLPAEYIKAMSDPDDIIIEPFGGSGTTMIACEQLQRKCRIMELEPRYVDVIIKRWEEFTGLKAELLNR